MEGLRKEVSLVIGSKLFTCDGERWAGYTTCEQIYTSEICSVYGAYIAFNHMLDRAVVTQGLASHRFDFNGGYIAKTRVFYA